MTGWHSWSRLEPRPFYEASTWILMALWTSKYHVVVSVQTKYFRVSKASCYDSFHVNSVPFLGIHGEVQ